MLERIALPGEAFAQENTVLVWKFYLQQKSVVELVTELVFQRVQTLVKAQVRHENRDHQRVLKIDMTSSLYSDTVSYSTVLAFVHVHVRPPLTNI